MNRQLTRITIPGAFVALGASAVVFGRTPQDVEVTVHRVAGNVSCLVGQGGNIGVSVGADGVLMVDDQFAPLADEIEAAVAELSDAAPSFVVNTHWHGDHTGGNAHFGAAATIFAHTNVRRRLAGDLSIGGNVAEPKAPPAALPVVTYADGLSIHFNGEEIRLIHVPGAHTDGDTAVWFTGSNVVHLGDLFFQLGYPYIDIDSGGDVEGIIAGLGELLTRLPEDVRVIPGHGEPTGLEDVKDYVAMLSTITVRIRGYLDEGKSLDEIQAALPTQEFDARWGNFNFMPPQRFVEIIVRSLSERSSSER